MSKRFHNPLLCHIILSCVPAAARLTHVCVFPGETLDSRCKKGGLLTQTWGATGAPGCWNGATHRVRKIVSLLV